MHYHLGTIPPLRLSPELFLSPLAILHTEMFTLSVSFSPVIQIRRYSALRPLALAESHPGKRLYECAMSVPQQWNVQLRWGLMGLVSLKH
jgi:hypothetical protein